MPRWHLHGGGARDKPLGRPLGLRPSMLGEGLLTRTTAASLALCAIARRDLANKSPVATPGPTPRVRWLAGGRVAMRVSEGPRRVPPPGERRRTCGHLLVPGAPTCRRDHGDAATSAPAHGPQTACPPGRRTRRSS